ncbi:MAG: hypothetical protein H0U57_01745 [Tatlockia sp.]|nr:hypothetical protein [Tatlockia sp.]
MDIVKFLYHHTLSLPMADGSDALNSAAKLGHLEIVELLSNHPKADIENALRQASYFNQFEVVSFSKTNFL